jgi:hypothetical protein
MKMVWFFVGLLAGSLFGQQWHKGQLHCHSTQSSDNPAGFSPADLLAKYLAAGYDFVAITDHFKATKPESFGAVPAGLLAIYGIENSAGRIVHINGFDVVPNSAIYPYMYDDSINMTLPMLQEGIDTLVSIGARLVQINHPDWSILATAPYTPAASMQAIAVTHGALLIEVLQTSTRDYNGVSNNEEVWDTILSHNKIMWGTGSDDFHSDTVAFNKNWVMVNAPVLSKEAIFAALETGDFYASAGPVINRIVRQGNTLTVESRDGVSIVFIGSKGRTLRQVDSASASYSLTGNELYVRARVVNAAGKAALTQPVFKSGPVANKTVREEPKVCMEVFPNHCNPSIRISFQVLHTHTGSLMKVRIIDIRGRLVKTLVENFPPLGRSTVVWEGTDESGRNTSIGTYFVQFQTGQLLWNKPIFKFN